LHIHISPIISPCAGLFAVRFKNKKYKLQKWERQRRQFMMCGNRSVKAARAAGKKALMCKLLVIAAVMFAAMPFTAAASYDSWDQARRDMWRKEGELKNAKMEAEKAQAELNQKANARSNAAVYRDSMGSQYRAQTGLLNKAQAALKAEQNKQKPDAKKVKALQADVDKRQAEAAPIIQKYNDASAKFEAAKKDENTAKAAATAANKKVLSAEAALSKAQTKEKNEKPWYMSAVDAMEPGVNATINFGKKVFKVTDWDKMEKATSAAAKALGLAKNPPEKIINALDTTGKYFGYIGTTQSAVGNLKEMLAAGAKYKTAATDSAKIDAIASISIATLNSLETLVGIKGGVITSLAANIGNQFLTALIKAVASTLRIMKGHNAEWQLTQELTDNPNCASWDEKRIIADYRGYYDLALRMAQSGTVYTGAQVIEALDAAKVLKNP
jgi:hypothetical protein